MVRSDLGSMVRKVKACEGPSLDSDKAIQFSVLIPNTRTISTRYISPPTMYLVLQLTIFTS